MMAVSFIIKVLLAAPICLVSYECYSLSTRQMFFRYNLQNFISRHRLIFLLNPSERLMQCKPKQEFGKEPSDYDHALDSKLIDYGKKF